MSTMRRPLFSMVILLSATACLAPSRVDAAKVRQINVPKSAATLAMDSVDLGEVHLLNISVNDSMSISQPVAPGSTVRIRFDWTFSQPPGCPGCLIQGYVGFQGTAATCFASGVAGQTAIFHGNLTAPDKPGTYLIMVNETRDAQCKTITSGGGGLPSIAAVVAILKVK